jgi:hypothetical protein
MRGAYLTSSHRSNFGANYWGVYGSNRLSLAESQYAPLLAYRPRAEANARAYGVDGALHFGPHIGPWGMDSTLGPSPGGDMGLHWAGVMSALNPLQHWEFTLDRKFLAEVAFPFCRDTLAFYIQWMRRPQPSAGGEWRNDRDSDECMRTNESSCYSPNLLYPNAFIRRLAHALPRMATALGVAPDPVWAEIATHLVAMAHGPCAAGAPGAANHTVWLDSDTASPPTGFRQPLGDGQGMAGLLWPVYPGEVLGRCALLI